jgi:tetratricopeptide (TPR) repeat protein
MACLALLLLGAPLPCPAAPSPRRAPPRPAPPPVVEESSDVTIAKSHFTTGVLYYDRGRFADAAREFEEAYRLSQRTELLYNMGKAYDGLSDSARALVAYRRFIEAFPSTPDAAVVRRRIAQLEGSVGRLSVTSTVPGARLEVDELPVGELPLSKPIELNPGDHALVLSKEGYRTVRQRIAVSAGSLQQLELPLESLTRVQLKVVEVERPRKPLVKQWWLWTLVGVVAVGGATTAAVLATREAPVEGPSLRIPVLE